MTDAWQAFQKALNADPALQARLKAAYQEALHSVASAAGFDLTNCAELSDDDVLELVGGASGTLTLVGGTNATLGMGGSSPTPQITYPG